MANTMTLISTYTVGAGGISTISFTGIPATYTDLRLLMNLKPATGDTGVRGTFNSSTSGYYDIYIQSLSGTPAAPAKGSNVYGNAAMFLGSLRDPTAGGGGGNLFGNAELYIPNYTASWDKAYMLSSVSEANTSLSFVEEVSGRWANSAVINRIDLTTNTGVNWAQYSVASLYGILNA